MGRIQTILFIIVLVATCWKVWGGIYGDSTDEIKVKVPSSAVVAAGTVTPKITHTPCFINLGGTQASKVAEAMDYTNPTTRDYSLSLIDKDHGGESTISHRSATCGKRSINDGLT